MSSGSRTQWVGLALIAAAAACSFDGSEQVGDEDLAQADFDGDGHTYDDDCNDYDSSVHPGAEEILYNGIDDDCDASTSDGDRDGDGVPFGTDCDDDDSTVFFGVAAFQDLDGDGHGGTFVVLCLTDEPLPAGVFSTAADCDDDNPQAYPGAAALEPSLCAVDLDGDGYGDMTPPGRAESGSDCLDDDPAIYQPSFGFLDSDGDGFGQGSLVSLCGAAQASFELVAEGNDCDDTDLTVHPGAHESPDDGIDQDCSGGDLEALVAGGEFVDGAASCPGQGTVEAPYCTLSAAVGAADPGARVYVTAGTYVETASADEAVRLFGGYASDFASRSNDPRATTVDADGGGIALSFTGVDPAALVAIDGMAVLGWLESGVRAESLSLVVHRAIIESELEHSLGTSVAVWAHGGAHLAVAQTEVSTNLAAESIGLSVEVATAEIVDSSIAAGSAPVSTGLASVQTALSLHRTRLATPRPYDVGRVLSVSGGSLRVIDSQLSSGTAAAATTTTGLWVEDAGVDLWRSDVVLGSGAGSRIGVDYGSSEGGELRIRQSSITASMTVPADEILAVRSRDDVSHVQIVDSSIIATGPSSRVTAIASGGGPLTVLACQVFASASQESAIGMGDNSAVGIEHPVLDATGIRIVGTLVRATSFNDLVAIAAATAGFVRDLAIVDDSSFIVEYVQ